MSKLILPFRADILAQRLYEDLKERNPGRLEGSTAPESTTFPKKTDTHSGVQTKPPGEAAKMDLDWSIG